MKATDQTAGFRFSRPTAILATLALLIVIAAVGVRLGTRPPPTTNETSASHTYQPSAAQMKALGIAPVTADEFQSEVATEGSLQYDDEHVTPVYSPYTGRALTVTARLGDRVIAGGPLFAVTAQELAQGEADVATARATLDVARAAERRQSALAQAGVASEHDRQQAEADRVAAEAAWAGARNRLHILGQSDAAIDAYEHAPLGRGADTVVSAPVGGVVTQRAVAPGQWVTSAAGGGAPVFVIADVRLLWAVAWVRESDSASIRPGQRATVRIAARPDTVFSGTVVSVAAGLDPTTHRLPVRIEIPNRDLSLKPETYAEIRIATSDKAHHPAIPSTAVVYDGESARVFVEHGGSIEGRDVRLGRHHGTRIEVLDGLKVGERIVTASTLFVDHAASGE